MNSNVQRRLKEYCKYLELPFEIFAEDIGAAGELIYERSELYEDTLVRLAKRHPELEINWLFTGEGNMIAIKLDEYPQSLLEKMALAISENMIPEEAEERYNNSLIEYAQSLYDKEQEILAIKQSPEATCV